MTFVDSLHHLVIKVAVVLLICNLGCYLLIPRETQNTMRLFGNRATPLSNDIQCIVEPQYGDDCRVVDISSYEFEECGSRHNGTTECHNVIRSHCPRDECYIYMKVRNGLALWLSQLEMRYITSISVLYLGWTMLSPYWPRSEKRQPVTRGRSPRRRRVRAEQ